MHNDLHLVNNTYLGGYTFGSLRTGNLQNCRSTETVAI